MSDLLVAWHQAIAAVPSVRLHEFEWDEDQDKPLRIRWQQGPKRWPCLYSVATSSVVVAAAPRIPAVDTDGDPPARDLSETGRICDAITQIGGGAKVLWLVSNLGTGGRQARYRLNTVTIDNPCFAVFITDHIDALFSAAVTWKRSSCNTRLSL